MVTAVDHPGFLAPPPLSPAGRALFAEDETDVGYVMNVSRLWAYRPELLEDLFALMGSAIAIHDISARRRGVIVAATASAYGDSYCSIAWGTKLASRTTAEIAAAVLAGSDAGLTEDEAALARWARKVVGDPNATCPDDVAELRTAGFTDAQIFAVTVFIGLRLAFSTVNDALGAPPDAQFRESAPAEVLDAVHFGRPMPSDATPASHAPSHAAECGLAIEVGDPRAAGYVEQLLTSAARGNYRELIVSANLHLRRLGRAGAGEAAMLAVAGIDNSALVHRVQSQGR